MDESRTVDAAAPSSPQHAPRIDALRAALLAWYDAHRRDLPWRDAQDPWAVWVSEIMLQQTRVDTVRDYYVRWMRRFPTVADLADARLDDVLSAWQGLGYYSRARNLQRAAQAVVRDHGGRIPDQVDTLRALPGVGPYTAGAIASIAFGRRAALVDGNVLRVITRLDGIDDDIGRAAGQRAVWTRCEALVPHDRPGDFNQALMELGATVCTPRSPRCSTCPVADQCVALADDRVDALPVKRGRTRQRDEHRTALIIRDAAGRYLVARRPPSGLLAGMWEFPLVADDAARDDVVTALAVPTTELGRLDDVVHIFSHIRLTATPCLLEARGTPAAPVLTPYAETRWVDAEARAALARSRLMQKLEAAEGDGQRRLAFG